MNIIDKMKNQILIILVILLYSCAGNSPGVSNENNDYNKIINKYSGEYFIGVGTGKGSTKEMAIKIAKARALGELSDNIKVTILSELEIKTTATTHNETTQLDETVKEEIISIGNATVRSPEYEILNVSRKDAEFHAEVLVKKLINKHVEESAKSLELEDAGEVLMKMIIKEKE
jgi:CCR4-NOT transcriptional regulation complex NOT5 subunit|tara:strand:+ start:1016 stop:1537 length:522 start_codon:yes stop_codon:yes gene_type:complete